MSPTAGSGSWITRVAPATGALRPAGPPAVSRVTLTMAGCACGPGPTETVQVEPTDVTKNGASAADSIRSAAWSAPRNACTLRMAATPFGVLEMSRLAGVSNTTQMESPRRNTAAPAGLAKGKLNCTWPAVTWDPTGITPPGGKGLARTGSASTTSASGAASSGGGAGFSNALI